MYRRAASSAVVVTVSIVLMAGPGCDHTVKFDDQQFTEAMAKIELMAAAVDKTVNESAAWRKTLPELEEKLREGGANLMANEVKIAMDSFAANLGVSGKEIIAYIEATLKANIRAFRDALEKARSKVQAAKAEKKPSGIKDALDELFKTPVFLDPVVTRFIPAHVEVDWKDRDRNEYSVRIPRIEVHGWGFERPEAEAPRFGIAVVTQDGKERAIPPSAVFGTTPYLIQLKLDDPGLKFGPEDSRFVFKLSSNPASRRELPIHHVFPPQPSTTRPAERPTIVTHVRIEYWVSGDDKSPDEVVTHELTADGKVVVSRQTGSQFGLKPPFGAGERWDHRGTQGPYTARQLPGLKFPITARAKTEGEKKFDFGHQADRTFPLSDKTPVELGKGMKGRLDIRKSGTESWTNFSVRLYGITNKGYEMRYDKGWNASLGGAKNDTGWDFEWDKGQK